VSLNPFAADAAVAARHSANLAAIGPAVRAAASGHVRTGGEALAANMGGVLPAPAAAHLVETFGLVSVRDLMLLLVDSAREIARPPVSQFHVGAVGLEAETGHLVLGGNVEFPGTHLGFTVHGEGFVFTRAFSRGTSIAVIALGEAHPCAHCRQYLSEFAASGGLELIDPLGHALTLRELYPWPFDPAYLGEGGAIPGNRAWTDLGPDRRDLPAAILTRLLEAGARAHAPYSRCPGAVVLELADGNLVAGSSVESVAFNPTIQPIQAAFIDLIAHGYGFDDIRRAVLGTVPGGNVDYSASTRELLGKVAPQAELNVVGWSVR